MTHTLLYCRGPTPCLTLTLRFNQLRERQEKDEMTHHWSTTYFTVSVYLLGCGNEESREISRKQWVLFNLT